MNSGKRSDYRRVRRASPGFSMAEIAIALFILALGLLSIIALFPAALQFGSATVNRARAISLSRTAESMIKYNRVLEDLDNLADQVGSVYTYPKGGVTWSDEGDPTYSWNATIYPQNDLPLYRSLIDTIHLVQIRIYRNYPLRETPIEYFEIFLVH